MNRTTLTMAVVAGIVIGIVMSLGFYAITVSFSSSPKVSAQSSSTTSTTTDPWLMSCSDLHSTILNLQDKVTSVGAGSYVEGASDYAVPISGLLNYYTQVYNVRIQLTYESHGGFNPPPSGAGCEYP